MPLKAFFCHCPVLKGLLFVFSCIPDIFQFQWFVYLRFNNMTLSFTFRAGSFFQASEMTRGTVRSVSAETLKHCCVRPLLLRMKTKCVIQVCIQGKLCTESAFEFMGSKAMVSIQIRCYEFSLYDLCGLNMVYLSFITDIYVSSWIFLIFLVCWSFSDLIQISSELHQRLT